MEVEGDGEAQVTERKDDSTVVDYSPTRSWRHLVLFLVDNLLSAVVIAPLVVFFWRGTWELLNIYLFPHDQPISGLTCLGIGNIGLLCVVYLQKPLSRWIRLENPLHWIFGYHAYTYVLGGLNICQWRGVWILLDHYTGINVLSSSITSAIGQIGLWILRSSKAAGAAPNVTIFDRKPDYFAFSTRFGTQASKKERYLLDTLLTVWVIHQLVVFYWRGVWELFDVHLVPDDLHTSAVICLIIAYTLQLLVCLTQMAANAICRSKRSKVLRWALELVVFFFANLVGVALWRGVWLLLNYHLMPDNLGLSAGVTHLVGIVVLWLMVCGHTVTTSGCSVDGESAVEEACLSPNYYLRLFFTKPRKPAAAADCNGNESVGNAASLQNRQDATTCRAVATAEAEEANASSVLCSVRQKRQELSEEWSTKL